VKKTLTVFLLSSALAAALMAQAAGLSPRSPQNRVKFMTAQLGLTAEQQSQATAIFTNAQTSESTLRASLKIAHQGLNDAVKSNNTVGIEQLSATVGNLAAQLALAQSKARAAFYQILAPEQRAKLDQLESQHWRAAWPGSRASGQ
jgi:Spy/CpxP family protein refolding chaperone